MQLPDAPRYLRLLYRKIELLEDFEFPEMTVCEDVPGHYEYFKSQYNYNPEDCCNLGKASHG